MSRVPSRWGASVRLPARSQTLQEAELRYGVHRACSARSADVRLDRRSTAVDLRSKELKSATTEGALRSAGPPRRPGAPAVPPTPEERARLEGLMQPARRLPGGDRGGRARPDVTPCAGPAAARRRPPLRAPVAPVPRSRRDAGWGPPRGPRRRSGPTGELRVRRTLMGAVLRSLCSPGTAPGNAPKGSIPGATSDQGSDHPPDAGVHGRPPAAGRGASRDAISPAALSGGPQRRPARLQVRDRRRWAMDGPPRSSLRRSSRPGAGREDVSVAADRGLRRGEATIAGPWSRAEITLASAFEAVAEALREAPTG
jgi:hypothetical protein